MNSYYSDDNSTALSCRQLPVPTVPQFGIQAPQFGVQSAQYGIPYTEPSSVPDVTTPTVINPNYTQGYLRTKIGKSVRIEFLIGSTSTTDRNGIIEEVGVSYIVLRDANTGNKILCDLYAIKFVTFFD